MRRPLLRGVLFPVLFAATVAACGSEPPPLPLDPDPTPVTETFTGTVGLNGSISFPFTVNRAGSANATLIGLQPSRVIKTEAGGTGNFVVGERVYVGDNPDEPTAAGIVHTWNPATGTLWLTNPIGTFVAGNAINGPDSGAVWTTAESFGTTLSLAMGVWNGATCSLVLVNDSAFLGDFIAGVVQGAGTLCARVSDSGRLEIPTAFTLEVTHF